MTKPSQPVDTTKTWNLDDIITLEEFPAVLKQAYSQIDELAEFFTDHMTPNMSEEDFIRFTDLNESTTVLLHRLGSRPELELMANQKDSEALKLKNQCKDLMLYYADKLRNVELWLQGKEIVDKAILDDANASRLFMCVPDLTYILEYDRMMGRHSLSAGEENLAGAKDANGVSVLFDLRGVIESEMKFIFRLPGQKERIIDSYEELNAHKFSPDPEVRREAFRSSFEQFNANIDKYFMIFQSIVKDYDHMAKIRGYASPIAMRNAENHVPDAAIETLMNVCVDNNKLFQRYFQYKAKALGLPKLTRFDLYAPVGEDTSQISYEDAEKLVLDTYEEFSPAFATKARSIVEASHIHSHPGGAKMSGAYCLTVAPSIKPYVHLNFAGKGRDVSTIAHELGHGIHSLYADSHGVSGQNPGLPLAETASTFGEMILFEKLLAKAETVEQKRFLLADKMADSYAAIMRQNYFVKFELDAHHAMQKGITEQELSQLWLDGLHEQFGESVEVDNMFAQEWACVPHLVDRPFYCYAYNFGELLSLALYKRYKDEGESFIPKIEKILAAGGSESPEKVLAEVGIDMTSAQFWQDSFAIIEGWQDQLEQLG